MAGGLPIRRAGQYCSSTRGRVTARPRAGLAERARETGIEAIILAPGQDLAALAHEAVAAGADALGMASGDGSLAVVAAVAAAHRRDRCTQPVGTRPDRNSPSSGKPAGTYRLKATVLSHLWIAHRGSRRRSLPLGEERGMAARSLPLARTGQNGCSLGLPSDRVVARNAIGNHGMPAGTGPPRSKAVMPGQSIAAAAAISGAPDSNACQVATMPLSRHSRRGAARSSLTDHQLTSGVLGFGNRLMRVARSVGLAVQHCHDFPEAPSSITPGQPLAERRSILPGAGEPALQVWWR